MDLDGDKSKTPDWMNEYVWEPERVLEWDLSIETVVKVKKRLLAGRSINVVAQGSQLLWWNT